MTHQQDVLQGRRASCCVSRVGRVKARYPTELDAKAAGKVAWSTYRTQMEAYECDRGGAWHLRKARGHKP